MAEQTVQVPLTGSQIVSDRPGPAVEQQPPRESGFVGGTYQPPEGRQSLHRVRMGASIARQEQVEVAPQWVENKYGAGRFEYRPVERQAEPEPSSPPQQTAQPNDAISQQISQLTNVVTVLAQRQLGIEPDTGPRMPDPAQFDFYNPEDEAQYHQALQKYVEDTVQQRIQKEVEPYRPGLQNIQKQHEMESQFNELVAQHGAEPNFKTVMSQALHIAADSGISIKDAYAKADSRDNRPGERGGHLPKHLTQGKFPRFGEILLHNQLSGRSGRR